MKISTIIIGIIFFAIATMIIYAWGMSKQKRQSSDLMSLLFSNGVAKVKKYLKKNEYITIADIENLSEGLEAKIPFSRNRAVVKDKKDYAKRLVEYMIKTGQIEKDGARYKKVVK